MKKRKTLKLMKLAENDLKMTKKILKRTDK